MELESALKDEEKDFHITNDERLRLVEILAFTSVALRGGKLYFNSPEDSPCFADFCEEMARRFANMPVHNQQ